MPTIYSAGLTTLLNSFDAEFQRAFSSNLAKDVPRQDNKGSRGQQIEIDLTEEEKELFTLLRQVTKECGMKSTLRVAGGWVRDKILASKEFNSGSRREMGGKVGEDACGEGKMGGEQQGEMKRITSKFKGEKGELFMEI